MERSITVSSYEELKNNDMIESKLRRYLMNRKWEKAEKRLEKFASCVIDKKKVTNKQQYELYRARYKDQLPTELEFVDGFGNSLIHTAALRGAPLSLIKKIVRLNPESIKQVSELNNGWYPLHMLCHSPGVLKSKHDSDNSEMEETRSKLDSYSLEMEESILWMIEKYPEALTIQDMDSSAPLHTVLEHKPSLRIVQKMIEFGGLHILKLLDVQRQVPLHIALDYKANESVCNLLIDCYPDATEVKMCNDYLPLHFAAQSGCSLSVLQKLLTHFPTALEITTLVGDTAFHLLFEGYRKKFKYDTGESSHEGFASIEDMIKTMLQSYYDSKVQQTGPSRAKTAVVKFLSSKKGADKKTVYELARHKVPEKLLTYLTNLKKGRIALQSSNSNSNASSNVKQNSNIRKKKATLNKKKRISSVETEILPGSPVSRSSSDDDDDFNLEAERNHDHFGIPTCSEKTSFEESREPTSEKTNCLQEDQNPRPQKKSRKDQSKADDLYTDGSENSEVLDEYFNNKDNNHQSFGGINIEENNESFSSNVHHKSNNNYATNYHLSTNELLSDALESNVPIVSLKPKIEHESEPELEYQYQNELSYALRRASRENKSEDDDESFVGTITV